MNPSAYSTQYMYIYNIHSICTQYMLNKPLLNECKNNLLLFLVSVSISVCTVSYSWGLDFSWELHHYQEFQTNSFLGVFFFLVSIQIEKNSIIEAWVYFWSLMPHLTIIHQLRNKLRRGKYIDSFAVDSLQSYGKGQ